MENPTDLYSMIGTNAIGSDIFSGIASMTGGGILNSLHIYISADHVDDRDSLLDAIGLDNH